MATKTIESVKLSIKVKTGTTESGDDKFTSRNISDINPAIDTDDAFSVASKYGALQTRELGGCYITETSKLANA